MVDIDVHIDSNIPFCPTEDETYRVHKCDRANLATRATTNRDLDIRHLSLSLPSTDGNEWFTSNGWTHRNITSHTHTKGTSQLTGSMNNNVASLFLYLYLFLSSLISLFAPLLMFGGLIGWLAIIRRWMNQTKHWTLYTNKPTI